MRVAIIVALAVASLLCACSGATLKPSDVKVKEPAKAVSEARRLIAERRADPKLHSGWLYPASLPESLRINGLVYASVKDDHVNLVLARNPDWELGARIWSKDASRRHSDKSTQYPGIMFFEYSNDRPESPGNIQ